jgi:hypothetical protein
MAKLKHTIQAMRENLAFDMGLRITLDLLWFRSRADFVNKSNGSKK